MLCLRYLGSEPLQQQIEDVEHEGGLNDVPTVEVTDDHCDGQWTYEIYNETCVLYLPMRLSIDTSLSRLSSSLSFNLIN